VSTLEHADTRRAVDAERAFLARVAEGVGSRAFVRAAIGCMMVHGGSRSRCT